MGFWTGLTALRLSLYSPNVLVYSAAKVACRNESDPAFNHIETIRVTKGHALSGAVFFFTIRPAWSK